MLIRKCQHILDKNWKAKVKIPCNLLQQFLSTRSWLGLRSRRDYVSGFKVALRRPRPFVSGFAPMTPRCFGGRPPAPRYFGEQSRFNSQTWWRKKSVVPGWVWTADPWDRALALGYCPHFSSQLLGFIANTPKSRCFEGKRCSNPKRWVKIFGNPDKRKIPELIFF